MPRISLLSWSLTLLLLALAVSSGCKKQEPSTSENGKSTPPAPAQAPTAKRIGVSLLTVQHQFYQDLREGLKAEAAKHGYELLITTAESDSVRQSNQIDEFIVQNVDAIVVCPCDSRSVGAGIAQANKAGILVFTADIASTATIGKVVSHIASDNKLGGRLAAELMARALDGQGTVAILSHPEVSSVRDRVAGFKAELAKHAGIEIVAELSAEGKRDKAAQVMEDLLQSHPELNGVFGINDDSALGALAAIQSAGRAGQVKIVGYDATPEAREKINAGLIYGDVIQYPRRIGELTIRTIHEALTGHTPAAVIPVEVGTYTGDSK